MALCELVDMSGFVELRLTAVRFLAISDRAPHFAVRVFIGF